MSFNVSHSDYLGNLGVAGAIVIMCPVDRFRPVVQRLADGGSRTRSSPAEMEILMPEPGDLWPVNLALPLQADPVRPVRCSVLTGRELAPCPGLRLASSAT